MLPYFLAMIIAIGSFCFYVAAFFVPEIHRRQDFLWSGIGMFYALVLWVCAERITGAVLLGQTASVGLLGWLGWQTLTLRRELTPEIVRTPVTWADLQRWGQSAQQMLRKYVHAGSLVSGVKLVGADLTQAIADIRNRIAGPNPRKNSAAPVPPLRRSPAYEFETETGQGESVAAEFVTVPPRAQVPVLQKNRPQQTPSSPLEQAFPKAVETPSDSDTASTAISNPDEKPSSKVGLEAAASESAPTTARPPLETAPDKAVAATAASARATVTQTETQSPPKSSPPKTTAATQQRSPTPKVTAQPPSQTGSRSWLGGLVRSLRKPKPQRAVIEIPPRPPSIPRSSDAQSSPAAQSPSSPAAKPETPRQTDLEKTNPRPVSPPASIADNPQAMPRNPDRSPSESPPEPTSAATSPSEPMETNWPEDPDTNWPD